MYFGSPPNEFGDGQNPFKDAAAMGRPPFYLIELSESLEIWSISVLDTPKIDINPIYFWAFLDNFWQNRAIGLKFGCELYFDYLQMSRDIYKIHDTPTVRHNSLLWSFNRAVPLVENKCYKNVVKHWSHELKNMLWYSYKSYSLWITDFIFDILDLWIWVQLLPLDLRMKTDINKKDACVEKNRSKTFRSVFFNFKCLNLIKKL